jgi:threonine dehydrogenase-like Zn-dependent dehydrogenase
MAQVLLFTSGGIVTATTPLDRVRPRLGHALVELLGSTICEADRRSVTGSKQVDDRPASTVLGHEGNGRVIDVGEDATVELGDLVAVMPHQVPEDQQRTEAFRRGEIYKLHTQHAGMHCDGTLATHIEWPTDGLRKVGGDARAKAEEAARRHGVHWSLAVAETEHLACVFTSFDLACEAEMIWNGQNLSELRSGQGRAVIVGAGWMGWLWYLHLTKLLPHAEVWIREPDEGRQRLFVQLAREVTGRMPQIASPLDPSVHGSFSLGVMATAARPAATEMFSLLRPGGHLALFSGIHEGATRLLFDPARLCDLERIHRDGIHTPVYRTPEHSPDDMVIASGSSGYSVACFERAVEQIGDYVTGIAAGISGVVLGMEGDRLNSVRPWAANLQREDGRPVLEQLFQADWPGRTSHLKIGVHPNPTDELREFYGKEVR